jgi:hypothetical protein
MIASNELKLKKLTMLTKDFIVENSCQLLQNDPAGILRAAHCHKSLTDLQEYFLKVICPNPETR